MLAVFLPFQDVCLLHCVAKQVSWQVMMPSICLPISVAVLIFSPDANWNKANSDCRDERMQEDSMDEGGGEMKFSLPAAPSPGPLLFLLAACREVARAGGHTTGAVPVQLLQWQLSNAVLQAFRCNH